MPSRSIRSANFGKKLNKPSSHNKDIIARNKHMSGAIQLDPNVYGTNQGHSISDFENTINNLPEGHYVYQNGQFVKTQ